MVHILKEKNSKNVSLIACMEFFVYIPFYMDMLFRDRHHLIMHGTHLTAQEIFTAFTSHTQARGVAGASTGCC